MELKYSTFISFYLQKAPEGLAINDYYITLLVYTVKCYQNELAGCLLHSLHKR